MNYVSQVASNKQHRREIFALASGGRLSFLLGSWTCLVEGYSLQATVTTHLLRGPKLFPNIHYSTSHKFYKIDFIYFNLYYLRIQSARKWLNLSLQDKETFIPKFRWLLLI